MNNHTPAPWTLDADGFTRMEDQIQCLRENQGTQHEWTFVGKNDEDGFAMVTALAHPSNAEFIVRAVNNHDELVAALGDLVTWAADMGGWEATAWRRAEALLEKIRKESQP